MLEYIQNFDIKKFSDELENNWEGYLTWISKEVTLDPEMFSKRLWIDTWDK